VAEHYKTRDHKLVIHLYRSYKLPITFAAESTTISSSMQRELLATIKDGQADFLAKIAQLRHNCTNSGVRVLQGTTYVPISEKLSTLCLRR